MPITISDPPPLDPQVLAAVTQANALVVGSAPAVAVAMLSQTTMHALTLSLQNATFAHQQLNITSQSVTTLSVAKVLGTSAPGGEPIHE